VAEVVGEDGTALFVGVFALRADENGWHNGAIAAQLPEGVDTTGLTERTLGRRLQLRSSPERVMTMRCRGSALVGRQVVLLVDEEP
jgi:hypothetical protein